MESTSSHPALIGVLREVREYLARPGNDFGWSSWNGAADALQEIDRLVLRLESGHVPRRLDLEILFAPSSDWGDEFMRLADKFDAAMKAV